MTAQPPDPGHDKDGMQGMTTGSGQDTPIKLKALYCLGCKFYGVILWRRHGEITSANSHCFEPKVPDDRDAKILIEMINTKSDRISPEYQNALPEPFDCIKREVRL